MRIILAQFKKSSAFSLVVITATFAGIQSSSAQLTVSGGALSGLDGDTVQSFPAFGPFGGRFVDGASDTNTTAAATLDMGTYRWVSEVTVLNRNVNTGLQMNNLYVNVAADQSAQTNVSGYNISMNAGSSGGPSPSVTTASTLRTLNLSRPVYRRYIGLTGMNNSSGGATAIDFGDINVVTTNAPTGHDLGDGLTVMAQAGTDTIGNIGELGSASSFQAVSEGGDNKIYLLLDFGSPTRITGLEFINRQSADTSLNVGATTVWAAADESAPAFDPQLQSSFTTSLASGSPAPASGAASAARNLNFSQGVTRRYLLLEVTGNLFGALGTGSAGQNVQFGDINVLSDAVSGGILIGLDGDTVVSNPSFGPYGQRFTDGSDTNTTAAATLDMGTYRWVSEVTVLNRNVNTGLQMNNLYVNVAADQSAQTNVSGYNISMNAGSSGGPSPSVTTASTLRTLNLSRPVYRRYLGLTGITSLSGGNGIADIGDLNVAGSAPAAHSLGDGLTVMAQAGTDTIGNFGELGAATSFQAVSQGNDDKIYLLLDFGAAADLAGLEFINRQNTPTSLNVGKTTVWAAADESAPGFDPQLQSSFTVSLATGTPSPAVTTTNTSRTLGFSGSVTRRYLLLEVAGNLFGVFSGGNQNAQFGDIGAAQPTINVSASLTNFSATAGSASVSQSFSAGGTALTDDILVTAPADYEVSTNNTAFAASVTLIASGGTVSATAVYVRIAASAPIGSPAGLISLTSTGASTQNIAVAGTVSAAGETFANWAQGAPLNSANLLRYAIGGASGPSATNGIAMINTVTSSNISITAIVRTNDPSLTVLGQALTDLNVGPWSTNNVTMQPGDQNGVGEGLQRQIWSTPRNDAAKKFLRLQSTLGQQ